MFFQKIHAGLFISVLSIFVSALFYLCNYFIFNYHILNVQTYWDSINQSETQQVNRSTTRPITRDDVIWFIHVSDIHITFNSDKTKENLLQFLDIILPTISPYFVLATGDLTNAKHHPTPFSSGQIEEEWEFYYNTLKSRNINSTFWIDVPGNHDKFNIGDSSRDLYNIYGIQSKNKSILHTINSNIGDVNILALDASPFPGLGLPLNFYGHLNQSRLDMLEGAIELLKSKNASTLRSIVICHYPICTMSFSHSSHGSSFYSLSTYFSLYLSGHLHNLVLGLGDELMIVHPSGFAEIEVGDLQIHQQFNIYSLTSRDTFSWSSHTLNDHIFLHIISPKDSRFLLSSHETNWIGFDEFGKIIVDLLIFPLNKYPLSHITISIDGISKTVLASEISLPYFSYTWNESFPNIFETHSIKVVAFFLDGTFVSMGHNFSLIFEKSSINSIGSKILSFPFISFFSRLFWILYFFIFVIIGLYSYFNLFKNENRKRLLNHCSLFTLIILTPFIPLNAGKFITNTSFWQILFYRGLLNFNFHGYGWILHADFSVFYSLYWSIFIIPSTCLLMIVSIFPQYILIKIILFIIFLFGTFLCFIFPFNYGTYSFLISPGITWIYFLLLYWFVSVSFLTFPIKTNKKQNVE